MARNGSGTYSLVAGNPVVTGTTVSSTWANTTLSDIATALTQSIAVDGQSPITANLPLNNHKLTGVAAGSTAGDALVYAQSSWSLAAGAITGALAMSGNINMSSAVVNLFYGTDVASAATIDLDSVTGNNVNITGTTPITAVTLTAGRTRIGRFTGITTLTPGAGLVIQGGVAITTAVNDIAYFTSGPSNIVYVQYFPVSGLPIVSPTQTIQRGYIDGLVMSTAGSSTTMTVAAGQATNSTNAVLMSLAASISKTTAAWAVGSAAGGKAETGAAANNTSYHFYEIRRPDTGIVDVCFSTSATGLVAGSYVAGGGNVADAYTQFRRIGSARTNGSAQWVKFIQRGDQFTLDVQSNDYNSANNPGTSAILIPLTSIPIGIVMQALFVEQCVYNNSFYYTLYTDPAQTDSTPGLTNFTFYGLQGAGGQKFGRTAQTGTDTSSQVRRRQDLSGALDSFQINTVGWIDQRGKNA